MAEMRRWRADQPLTREMEISDQEVDRRQEFLELRQEDEAALQGLIEIAQKYADPVIEDPYRHFPSEAGGRGRSGKPVQAPTMAVPILRQGDIG
jgi:hypothetical protein